MYIVNVGGYGITVHPKVGVVECVVRRIHPQNILMFRVDVTTKTQLWELLMLVWCAADDGERLQAVVYDVNSEVWLMTADLKRVLGLLAATLSEN